MNSSNVSTWRARSLPFEAILLAAVTCLGITTASSAQEKDPPNKKHLLPIPPIQEKIEKHLYGGTTRQEIKQLTAEFVDWVKKEKIDNEKLFEQLIIYSANHKGFVWQMAVIGPAELRLPPYKMVNIVAPHLDLDQSQTELQEVLLDVLRSVDQSESLDRPIFEHYKHLIRNNLSDHSQLVRYMFRVHPGEALDTILLTLRSQLSQETVQEIASKKRAVDDCLWQQRWKFIDPRTATDEAQQALLDLSQRKESWVQLYVVYMMAWQKEFRRQEVIDILEKSNSDDVRAVLQQHVKPMKKGERPPNRTKDGVLIRP